MYIPKFDIFVCSPRRTNLIIGKTAEPIISKLYTLLRQRLTAQGFGNVIQSDGQESNNSSQEETLNVAEYTLLLSNPFFISEHYLTKPISFDHNSTAGRRQGDIPWRSRPSFDAYQFCNRGQAPMFHVAIAGGVCKGKTYVINEFKVLLNELVPGIEIVVCDNGLHDPDNWDIASDPIAYAGYRNLILTNSISIGVGPTMQIGIDDNVYHNTKV